MTYAEIYTSREDYVSILSTRLNIDLKCECVPWLWNAYELLNIDTGTCLSNDELMLKYIDTYRKLRIERSVRIIANLKNELMTIRGKLRKNCSDELLCLANRLYEYDKAVNTLYSYYLKTHELGNEELSKLSVAFSRYNMPTMSLTVFNELINSSAPDDLKYLTFISLFNPITWPLHITMDIRILPYLNWVLIYIGDHYVLLIMSLGRAYAISDLNINIDGSRMVLSNDFEFRSVMSDYIITNIESLDGHGLIFMGNWSEKAVNFTLDHKLREGSVKGLFLDSNVSTFIPIIVPPHDYLSIKYSV